VADEHSSDGIGDPDHTVRVAVRIEPPQRFTRTYKPPRPVALVENPGTRRALRRGTIVAALL